MLVNIEPREYQINVYKNSIDKNTLIVMPTGLGKTLIAAMLIEKFFKENKKSIFLAPTKPLVLQHMATLVKVLGLNNNEICAFTGEVDSQERELRWVTGKIFVSTPQVVLNDMKSGIIDITRFDLIVFDEAHRAVGNYAYVDIASEFLEYKKKLIIGLTASPGGEKGRFQEIVKNLGIENVVVKTEKDEDVRKYIKSIEMHLIKLKEPDQCGAIKDLLKSALDSVLKPLKDQGIKVGRTRKDMAESIQNLINRAKEDRSLFPLVRHLTAAIRIDYIIEYIETQGLDVAYQYVKDMEESQDQSIKRAYSMMKSLDDFRKAIENMKNVLPGYRNPKMMKVLEICQEKVIAGERAIVFTHFRATSDMLLAYLKNSSDKIKPVRFIGQADRGTDVGLSQEEQRQIIEQFRNGTYNVLIATSIAEEGLDIPDTDVVVFYEAVPSEIRFIQRKGRTGRSRSGEVYILVYENSRDMAYYYRSLKKVSMMNRNIMEYRDEHPYTKNERQENSNNGQRTIFDF
ncbi:translation initiation factor eIF4A [Thermoplasma volcanium GSS1]|uniref:Translation initiation factor eIF4A n=1 Tax=Thermoplasma volcanium (strain ATCC 51530 / DSM 4299 / JCM 9571 / NBRC 15438 / GSS1) TaxID=273116 RepID=Q978A0_THEVO|nr:DEAD/DEAH box helicase family protein [Thermoplasma volcanium]BAB60659.1 translation initiation factor eIF4A [Thermoplasma volcanium GSS1]